MNINPNEYAKVLVERQGKSEAKRIAEDNVRICDAGNNTILFDEAEFYISTEGSLARYELNKTQSKKVVGKKANRDNSNLAFWKQVLSLVSK